MLRPIFCRLWFIYMWFIHSLKYREYIYSVCMLDSSCREIRNKHSRFFSRQDEAAEESHTFATSSWTQFRVLFYRTFLCIIRDAVSSTCNLCCVNFSSCATAKGFASCLRRSMLRQKLLLGIIHTSAYIST